jgi:hypothetical protein
MKVEGGCYCGQVRYVAEGEPAMRAQCHCRECQYITGGGPNYFMTLPADGYRYVQGEPKRFARTDLERPVTREFCPNCGTHLVSPVPGVPIVIMKVGALDDPKQYGGPNMAIYTMDRQPFHVVPEAMPAFERTPQQT